MVQDPAPLLRKCARLKLRVLLSDGQSAALGSSVSAEEIRQWTPMPPAPHASDGPSVEDNLANDVLDLSDRSKTDYSARLGASVCATLKKKVSKRGLCADDGREAQHFRAFLEAHNAHVRTFQSLFDEPDDLSECTLHRFMCFSS
jgi:hypothetical protein